MRLKEVVDSYMEKTTGLKEYCERCLETKRWNEEPVLMVVDAAFTSIGLNYFQSVVPKVIKFEKEFVKNGPIQRFKDLQSLSLGQVESVWANQRSWHVARSVASYLHDLGESEGLSDREALRIWAANSSLENWRENPIGKIKGVGINTYQYLRMMGGVDTAMPDKIVRRVIEEIVDKGGMDLPTKGDVELVSTIDRIASMTGYRPIELCWMTWLVQSEGEEIRMEKYQDVLDRI